MTRDQLIEDIKHTNQMLGLRNNFLEIYALSFEELKIVWKRNWENLTLLLQQSN
jgi:hypothetical protein